MCKLSSLICWIDFNVLVRALGSGDHYEMYLSHKAGGNAATASKCHYFSRYFRILIFLNISGYIDKNEIVVSPLSIKIETQHVPVVIICPVLHLNGKLQYIWLHSYRFVLQLLLTNWVLLEHKLGGVCLHTGYIIMLLRRQDTFYLKLKVKVIMAWLVMSTWTLSSLEKKLREL